MSDGTWRYDEAPHICEAHPGKAWPHDDCPGPGVPIDTRRYFDAFLDIVFDGPPSHESGRFVEVEAPDGRSVNAGEWIDRGNGLWALRIPRMAPQPTHDPFLNLNATAASPEFDPRNLSAVPLMVEAGFRDLVRAVGFMGERMGDAVDGHAEEIGRQRS